MSSCVNVNCGHTNLAGNDNFPESGDFLAVALVNEPSGQLDFNNTLEDKILIFVLHDWYCHVTSAFRYDAEGSKPNHLE